MSIYYIATSFVFFSVSTALSQERDNSKSPMSHFEKVSSILESGDSYQAADYIESQGTESEVVRVYDDVTTSLYRQKKDVSRMLLLGRMAIRYCLDKAKKADGHDKQFADKLRTVAKVTAYNISVNAWPGWQEEGIVVTSSDSIVALDAARLNLRLALELKKPDLAVGNAYWLLGAQEMVQGEFEKSYDSFTKAATKFQTAKNPEYQQMALGYVAIAKSANGEHGGAQKLARAIESLGKIGNEDAKFFASQLNDVSKFFIK